MNKLTEPQWAKKGFVPDMDAQGEEAGIKVLNDIQL